MKKYMIIALILVLTLTLMAGCRRNTSGETSNPTDGATILPTDMMPDPTNGNATDGDGFIGDGNSEKSNRGIHGNMPIQW